MTVAFAPPSLWNYTVETVFHFEGVVTNIQDLSIWRSTSKRYPSYSEWNNSRRWSFKSSKIDLIGVASEYGTDSELSSSGKYESWNLPWPLSMTQWLSFSMITENTGLVLEREVLYLRGDTGGWLLHSLGDSCGSSPWRTLNLFIFLLRRGGRNFWSLMIQASYLCPILPQHLQIIFCLVRRSVIAGWRDAVSLLMEY